MQNFKFEKGKVYDQFKIIQVAADPRPYQEKWLFQIVLQSGNNQIIVDELCATKTSQLAQHKFQPAPRIVCITPGDGTPAKPAWVKLDDAMSQKTELGDRDNSFIARDAMRAAVDLYVAGKYFIDGTEMPAQDKLVAGLAFMARSIAKETISLSKSL